MPKLHCEIGNHDWDRPAQRGRPPRNCPEHKPETPSQTHPKPSSDGSSSNVSENLTCTKCKIVWTRAKTRGRKPILCPECKAKELEAQESKPKHGRTKGDHEIAKNSMWDYISGIKDDFRCTCELHKDLTYAELILMKGCKENYICSVLDRMRQRVHAWDKKSPYAKTTKVESETTDA